MFSQMYVQNEVYSIMSYSLYNQPVWTVTYKVSDVLG